MSQTKDATMTVTFYYISEFTLFNLVKVECTMGKETTLRTIIETYAQTHKQPQDSITFYFFNGKTYEWFEVKELDDRLGDVKFPDEHFFFLIQHKSKILDCTDPVQILFSLDGINKESVVGIRKLIKSSKVVPIKNLYLFFYKCLADSFGSLLPSFEKCFDSKDRLFDLYLNDVHLNFSSDTDSSDISTATVKDTDEINVKILKPSISKHKLLNSLGTSLCERFPEDKIQTLRECFDQLTKPERFDEDNKWFCEKCKQHKRAYFQLSIKELPPILIVHLKRFKKAANGTASKLMETINYPLEGLDLSECMSNPNLEVGKQNYSLFAVINHTGSANFGHYTALVRNCTNQNQWYICDDEHVSEVKNSEEFPIKAKAYILFYKRTGLSPKLALSEPPQS